MVCRLVSREDWQRARVEHHVQEVYRRAYGAGIRSFPDVMVADFDQAGDVRGAAGLRLARDGFFSECYVDRGFEELLSDLALERVGRDQIIEVTGLASASLRTLVRLIVEIIGFARRVGIEWAVFTRRFTG